jgi:hypothetical protein
MFVLRCYGRDKKSGAGEMGRSAKSAKDAGTGKRRVIGSLIVKAFGRTDESPLDVGFYFLS